MSASTMLVAFLGVSICIHTGLLLINLNQYKIELGSASTSEITVRLNQNNDRAPHNNSSQQTQSKTSPLSTGPENTRSSDASTHNKKQRQYPETTNLRQKKIKGQLRQELARFFYYPPQAQRRGIQGQVVISFILSQHGTINSASITKSSGYRVLDNAALDAFNQASRIFSASASSVSMYLKIPVRFQLSGG